MTTSMRIAGRKDVREEAAILHRLGFRYQGTNNAGHHVFDHPQHGEVVMANSPSAHYWRRSHRRQVAKAMGVSFPELEALIHGQAVLGKRGTAKRSRRGRRPSVAIRHLQVAPETVAAPAPEPEPPVAAVAAFDPCDPITSERRAHWAAMEAERVRANLSNPYPWRAAA